LSEAAEVAVGTVAEFVGSHEGIEEVRFVLFSPDALSVYLRAMEAQVA